MQKKKKDEKGKVMLVFKYFTNDSYQGHDSKVMLEGVLNEENALVPVEPSIPYKVAFYSHELFTSRYLSSKPPSSTIKWWDVYKRSFDA